MGSRDITLPPFSPPPSHLPVGLGGLLLPALTTVIPDNLEAAGRGTHVKDCEGLVGAHKKRVPNNKLVQNFFRDCELFKDYYDLEKIHR